ncbi:MAG: S8/S53 family peptidase [Bacteroidia bacterium]
MTKNTFSKIVGAFIILSTTVTAQNKSLLMKPAKKYFSMPAGVYQSDYTANTLMAAVKPQYRSLCTSNAINNHYLNQMLSQIGVSAVVKQFPNELPPERAVNKLGQKYADLSLTYRITYTSNLPIEDIINHLYAVGIFEYVQPHYIPKLCDIIPNDPDYSSQYALPQIKAPQGWGIEEGDTNVVIGIVDTGVELTHSDLKSNIKINYADPIDGIDNDGDGYIDNHYGWDVAENNNNPTWQSNPHGVHVSGIADAATDNSNGIAGVGFKCKFLPVKISDASGTLIAAYEGIQYAAAHGCAIINCSWGGVAGGPYGQSIVDYATINKNALVVAAAGNDGLNEEFYPASYQYVMDVASVGNTDAKSSFSNYGYQINVCAPGENIYSTWPGNSYSYDSGTSMASPCAAGVAAIIKSYFPSYSGLQVGEQLKVTCDTISADNPSYPNELGYGRVNMYKALTQTSSPSVEFSNQAITDNNDNVFTANDTLRITGNFTNYLAPATNLIATLTDGSSPYVTILSNTATLGAIPTLGVKNNFSNPFEVLIKPSAPLNQVINFIINMKDGMYSSNYYFSVIVNVDYINVTINDIATTITSKGLIGYDGNNQTQGLGFTYNGSRPLLYEAGLMIGDSATTPNVSDMDRGTGSSIDNDFQSMVAVHNIIPTQVSDFDLDGTFNDNGNSTPLPVLVHHNAYAWSTPGNLKYVIVQYKIKNTGTAPLQNMFAGIFADWDITDSTYNQDRAQFDSIEKMGYAYYVGAHPIYTGIKLLSHSAPVMHYAIDNDSSGSGGVNIYNGFTISEKYKVLSSNRAKAGMQPTGDDIADVVSSGPFNLNPGDTAVVAFALIAGDSLADLEASADSAQVKYMTSVPLSVTEYQSSKSVVLEQNFPNPATQTTSIIFNLPQKSLVDLSVYDLYGRIIAIIAHGEELSGSHQYNFNIGGLSSGIYYYRLSTETVSLTKKMMVIK